MLRATADTPSQLAARGFTLVELLVAMAVFALMLGIGMQLVSSTAQTTGSSTKRMATASMSRIALDRFEADASRAILTGGATVIYYGDSTNRSGNSAIGWATSSRSRFTTNTNVNQEVRGATVGYQVRELQYKFGQTSATIPILQRGDGRLSYRRRSSGDRCDYMFARIFGANELPGDLRSATTETALNFQGLGDGIVRFHVSFLQDDGSIVQVPPSYASFDAIGGTNGCLPIAFSAATSADPNKRFVKAMIVGVAVLDEGTLRLSHERDSGFLATIGTALERPMLSEETPVAVWSAKLTANAGSLSRPILQNLRFYQRLIPANL